MTSLCHFEAVYDLINADNAQTTEILFESTFLCETYSAKKAYNFILITNMTNALKKQQEQEHVTRSIFCW